MTTVTEHEIARQLADLEKSLHPLLRTKAVQLEPYLEHVECNVSILETRTQAHCYFLALDGNSRPRVNDFARFIADHIVDFAIPRVEISRALNEALLSGSTAPITKLNNKARRLFTKLPKSGEGGEAVLSFMAEAFLKIPQLFTKMVLKTNPDMHVHGSDGIHAGVNEHGNLALYWGESKLYQNVNTAMKACFESLAPFLIDPGGSDAKQERDLQLMRDGLSLANPDLEGALRHFLDPDDSMFNKMEFRGLCLVGFDSSSYPVLPNSSNAGALKLAIENSFKDNKKQIAERVKGEQLQSFTIEVFCLPLPSVDEFRKAFRLELGLSNEQG